MKQATPSFYNLAWRWHFYAGLFVSPFMIMLALTGIIYLFKPQLDLLMYPQWLQVPVAERSLDADQQLAVVRQAYPLARVSQYLPPIGAGRSAQFVIENGELSLNVFVDPYSGQLLGSQDAVNNLQALARAIHGELLIGTPGDRLIELAAGWGVVLVVSGLYLWWPRGRQEGVWWPRLAARGRLWWRDLHAVLGLWGALLMLFMLLSGMTWTGFWGAQFAGAWNHFPAAMWENVPRSGLATGSLNNSARQTVAWAAETTPLPASDGHGAHRHGSMTQVAGGSAASVSLQQIVAIATQRAVSPGYSISLPVGAKGVYTIAIFADDPRHDATVHVDQYSGAVLADLRWKDYGLVARAVEGAVVLHEGKLFGLANQLLMLGVCLMIVFSSVSGLVIWWKRRPQGSLGVPPLRHGSALWKTAVAIMLLLGVALPLVGGSMLLVGALDWLLRLRSARQLAGAES